jgi:hypothetical protein
LGRFFISHKQEKKPMDDAQGQTQQTSDAMQGDTGGSSDGAAAQVQQSQGTSDAAQGDTQKTFDPATHFQSIADQERAQRLAEQERADRLQQQLMEIATARNSPPTENPHDYSTNFPAWFQFEQQKSSKQLLEEARRINREELGVMIQQANDLAWQQKHPEMDINTVRRWGQMNNVNNLDHALTLMNLDKQKFAAAQAGYNQAFKQTTTTAALRSSSGVPGTVEVNFKEMAKQYANNPDIEKTWDPKLRDAFHRELNAAHRELNR